MREVYRLRIKWLFLGVLFTFLTGFQSLRAQSLRGQEFWFTLTQNQVSNSPSQEYFIYIVSQFCIDSAYLDLPFYNKRIYFSVEPGEFYKIGVPRQQGGVVAHHAQDDGVEDKGVHLVSPKPVSVYLLNYGQFTTDGETLIPMEMCGTSYVAAIRANGGLNPVKTTVIATENNTTVKINGWDNNGNPLSRTMTLNQGETYMFQSGSDCSSDYPNSGIPCQTATGATIDANKKVVVMSSSDCSNIGACGRCDAMMASFLPVTRWSKDYVNVQVIERNAKIAVEPQTGCSNANVQGSGDYIEITGKIGTKVTMTSRLGTVVQTIQAPVYGDYGYGYIFFEFPAAPPDNGEANVQIAADQPVQVMQYTKGRDIDDNATADPEALHVFSPDLWQSSYFFYPIYTPTAQNLEVTVVVNDIGAVSPTTSIEINGVNVGAGGWISIPNTTYKFKRIADPVFVSSRIESTIGAKFGFYFFARAERETAFFSGGYGPLANVSLCEQCADVDISATGTYCINSPINFEPSIYTFTLPSDLTYFWTFGDGQTSTQQKPVHEYAAFGTYKVTLLVVSGTGCSISATRTVQVNDINVAVEPDEFTMCKGDTLQVTSNPVVQPGDKVSVRYINKTNIDIPDAGIQDNWNGNNGNVATSVINIADNYSSGWTMDSVCVNIKHAKIRDVQIALQSPCGQRFKLAKEENTAGRANFRKTCFSPSATKSINSGLAPYTGNFIPEDGAGIWTTLQSCNPKGNWTLRVGDDSILVSGKIIDWSIYYSTTNAVSNFDWTPKTFISDAKSRNPKVYPQVTTTYNLAVNDFNQCKATDSVVVIIERAPRVLPSRDTVMCTNHDTINLFNLLIPPFDNKGTWTELSNSGRLVDNHFYVEDIQPGTYRFKYLVPVFCGFDSAVVSVTVNKLPNLGSPGTDTICNTNGPLSLLPVLTGKPDGGGVFSSSDLGGGTLSQNMFFPANAAEGVYEFYYKKPVQGCQVDSVLAEITLYRQRNPGGSFDTVVCERNVNIDLFTLLRGTPDAGGEWIDEDNTGKMTSTGVFNPLGLPTGDYSFRYRFIADKPCRDTSAVVTVRVNQAPFADISTTTPRLCIDSTATVKVNFTGVGPFNIDIFDGSSTRKFTNVTSQISFTAPVNQMTTYTITNLTDGNFPRCSFIRPDSITINIFTPIQATVIKEKCSADFNSFQAIVEIEGGDSMTYTANGVPFSGTTYTSPPIPNGTVYTITFSDSTNCSSDVLTDKKYCQCVSEASILSLALRQYCENDVASAIQLAPPVKEPEDTLVWVLHDKSGIALGNVLEVRKDSSFAFKPSYQYDKTYYISQVVGDAGKPGDAMGLNPNDTCIDVSRGTPVRWNQLPTAAIFGDTTLCKGGSTAVGFTFSGRAPFEVTLSINGRDTVLSGISDGHSISFTPMDTTRVVLKSIRDSNTPSCRVDYNQKVTIAVNPLPTVEITGGAVICQGSTTDLEFFLSGTPPFRINYTLDEVPQGELVVFTNHYTLTTAMGGTYRLSSVSDRYCEGIADKEAVTIEVKTPPVANAGIDFTNCGITARLNAIPSSGTGQWSGPGGFSKESDPRSFVLVNTFGTYSFTWTERNSPCPDSSDVVTVTFVSDPTARAGNDTAVCGLEVNLNADPSFGFGSWIYQGGDERVVFDDLEDPRGRVRVGEAGTYSFIWRESVNDVCVDRDTVMITFYDTLRAEVIRYNCNSTAEGYSMDIRITGGKSGTYRINGAVTADSLRTAIIPTGESYRYLITDSSLCGEVILQGSYECPCLSFAGVMPGGSMEVCGKTPFSIPYPNNYSLDGNDTLIFILHDSSGTSPGNILLWSHVNGFVRPDFVKTGVPYYISAVVGNKSPGLTGVNLKDRCLDVTGGFMVTFKEETILRMEKELVFCQGEDYGIDLVVTTPGDTTTSGSYSLSYSEGGVQKTASFTGRSYRLAIFPPVGESYYPIHGFTDGNNPGCSTSSTTLVRVRVLPPVVSDIFFKDSLCQGESAEFIPGTQGGINPGDISYLWDFGNGDGSEAVSPVTSYPNPGTYSVTLTTTITTRYKDLDGNLQEKTCRGVITKTDAVKVQATPKAGFTINGAEPTTYCYPAKLDFFNTTGTPPGDFKTNLWTLNGSVTETGKNQFVRDSLPRGSYSMTLEETTTHGCSSRLTKLFRIEGPQGTLTKSEAQVCSGRAAEFTITGRKDVSSALWQVRDEGGNLLATSTSLGKFVFDSLLPASLGSKYYVTLILFSRDGCSLTLRDSVKIIQVRAGMDISNSLGGDTSLCRSATTRTFFTDLSQNAAFWQWNFGETGSAGNDYSGQNPPPRIYRSEGTFRVSLTVRDSSGECTGTTTRYVVVHPLPKVSLEGDTICKIKPQPIEAIGEDSWTYFWNSPNVDNTSGKSVNLQSIVPGVDLRVVVTATDENGCKDSIMALYYVADIEPIGVFPGFDTTITVGDTVYVDIVQPDEYRYSWTPSEYTLCGDCPHQGLFPREDTEYILTIYDPYGCYGATPHYGIKVLQRESFDMPGGFTPNGDGINDGIWPDGWGIERIIRFEVYNRYGELIHNAKQSAGMNRTTDIGWDGTYKTKPQPPADYTYVVEYKVFGVDKAKVARGQFALIR
jgi:gliding motility-associated-like protein